MKITATTSFRLVPAVLLVASLAACEMMGGEGEFVQACLSEGKGDADKRMSDEAGVKRKAFCKCAAGEAKANLSPDGFRAMVLDMQGKSQEAREISSKMNPDERMAFLSATLKIFGSCATAGR